MRDVTSIVEEILHFGTKGMRWGVRKKNPSASGPQAVEVKVRPGKTVKTKGGRRQGPSPDAIAAAIVKQKAKKSTTDALSNQELQALVNRMNLEAQFSRLGGKTSQLEQGKKFVKDLIGLGKIADEAYSAVGKSSFAKDFGKSTSNFSGKIIDG